VNPKVTDYLSQATKWQDEMAKLRTLVLDCGLAEDFKWHQPCYTHDGGIVLLIGSLKDYCCLAFFKGALLRDPEGILVSPGANSQTMRQARFTSVREIGQREPVLKSYIEKAIGIEKAGLKVPKNPAVAIPEEFQTKLDKDTVLRAAFEALTPGRRRAYLMYFAQPKQSKTRADRIDKCAPQILAGKGLNDDARAPRK
jgi:uncharacterized protein YdeI (YjbR/CyaY-like superfamily)